MFRIITILSCFLSFYAFGQKVDIDNHGLGYHYAKLPQYNVDPTKRKLFVATTGSNALGVTNLPQSLRLFGWDVVPTSKEAEIDVKLHVKGMSFGKPQYSSRKEEKKDDKGNVISTTTYYKVSVTNEGQADLNIYGLADSYKKFLDDKKQLEKKKDDKKAEKKRQEEANNPFLSNVNKRVSESKTGTKPTLINTNLNTTYHYSTNEYTSSEAANKEFYTNANRESVNHENNFLNKLPESFENYLNNTFGFIPARHTVNFKWLDSDKHPEFNMFSNALKALKIILEKSRYNLPVEEIAADSKSISEYFFNLNDKLRRSTDKNDKKLRGAALYNYALLAYILDDHESCITACNELIEADIEKGDAKDLKDNSEKTAKQLVFFGMKSRHIVPITELDKKSETGKELIP
jgi:hypothetical protein